MSAIEKEIGGELGEFLRSMLKDYLVDDVDDQTKLDLFRSNGMKYVFNTDYVWTFEDWRQLLDR
jgi:hypothetical protein